MIYLTPSVFNAVLSQAAHHKLNKTVQNECDIKI